MKKAKWIVLLPALIMVFLCGTAFAADNMSVIEQKWLEFQRAVLDQKVKDGLVTAEKAKSALEELEKELNAGSEDVIYRHLKEAKSKKQGIEKKAVEEYAALTNRTKEDVQRLCEEKRITVWQLAEEEGNLEKFQNVCLNNAKEKFSQWVKEGKMTQEQMDEKLEKIKSKITRRPSKK